MLVNVRVLKCEMAVKMTAAAVGVLCQYQMCHRQLRHKYAVRQC
jgi:hypothetical protein